jgi:hypothetical protein
MPLAPLDNLVRVRSLKAEPGRQAEIDGLIRSGQARLKLVFQCLEHTVGLPNEQWRVLDQAHRKRNLAEYEGHVDVDGALLEALLRVSRELSGRVTRLGPVPQEGRE